MLKYFISFYWRQFAYVYTDTHKTWHVETHSLTITEVNFRQQKQIYVFTRIYDWNFALVRTLNKEKILFKVAGGSLHPQ